MKPLDLGEIRKRIDEIDTDIVALFEERMAVCEEVADYKLEKQMPVFDGMREKQKVSNVKELTTNEFNKQGVEELFTQIMTISRRMQYQKLSETGLTQEMGFYAVDNLLKPPYRVVFQGVEGAYSHGALYQFFGQDVDSYHVQQFEDVMVEIQEGRAEFGILPIENSSAGMVSEVYDLLVNYDNCIVAETFVKVEHCLLGLADSDLDDICTVFSHPQGLMQSCEYLNSHRNWKQINVENTAVAAKKVLEDGDKTQAAVSSEIAGKIYGLKILKSSVNHNKNNTTRFIILSKKKRYRRDAKKVSICFEIPHSSGTLYNMLSNFIYNHVNMTMIQSRPILGKNWEYRFYLDFEGNLDDSSVKNAIKGISEEAINMKILGSY